MKIKIFHKFVAVTALVFVLPVALLQLRVISPGPLGTFLMFLALLLVSAWIFSRSLLKTINGLIRAAGCVSAGDFSRGAEAASSDELGDLCGAFNRMAGQLKKYSDMQLETLRQEQKTTEAVLLAAEDGMVITDTEGRVRLANRKARSVLGLAAEAPVEGRMLSELPPAGPVREAVLEALGGRREKRSREIEVELEHSRRFFTCSTSQIPAPGPGVPSGRLVVFHDATLDRELARIKDEFRQSITHDLRNPVGAIKGFVEFMIKEIPGPVNESQKNMLASIDRALFRLIGMINNILDEAKMAAGRVDVNLAPVDLREIAVRVIRLMESLGQRKHIKFEVEGAERLIVNADSGLVERIFTNLIGNAIKFTPDSGVITAGISEDNGKALVWVRDTGDGIPSEYLEKIFEKFGQASGQKAGGTGLGLTICRYAVAAHLGKIWAESEPGKGAKFIFSFPKDLAKDEAGRIVDKGAA